jgi:hypothetical protein
LIGRDPVNIVVTPQNERPRYTGMDMGFTVYYKSTKPVPSRVREELAQANDELSAGRTWLSCEPVGFAEHGAYLQGGVKPNFNPHPDDIDSAKAEKLPDGTLRDAIEILCELSRRFKVDWQFGHDHDPGPIGFIRNGEADRRLLIQIDGIEEMSNFFAELSPEDWGIDERTDANQRYASDGPRILRFPDPEA